MKDSITYKKHAIHQHCAHSDNMFCVHICIPICSLFFFFLFWMFCIQQHRHVSDRIRISSNLWICHVWFCFRCLGGAHQTSLIVRYRHSFGVFVRVHVRNQLNYHYDGGLVKIWVGHVVFNFSLERIFACPTHFQVGKNHSEEFVEQPPEAFVHALRYRRWCRIQMQVVEWLRLP